MLRFDSLRLPLFLALSSLAACGGGGDDAPAPAALRSQLSADLGNVLRESSTAFADGTADLPLASTLSIVDSVLGTKVSETLPFASTTRTLARLTGSRAAEGTTLDADASVDFLNNTLFTDANHVGDGIYKIPASLVCSDIDANGQAGAVDPDCAAAFDKLQLRVRTAVDGDTLTLALQLDANHDEPLRLELDHTSLALAVDLDEAGDAIDALSSTLGAAKPNISLAGEIVGKLEVLGAAHAKASLSFSRALAIKVADAGASFDDPEAFAIASEASQVLAVAIDGVAKAGSFMVDFGATTIASPDDLGRRQVIDMAGASATAEFSSDQPLHITGISLGGRAATVKIDGALAKSIDLNNGGKLDATISGDDTAVTIAVSPKLDLQSTVDHGVLGDAARLYDVTRVQLEGQLQGRADTDALAVTGAFSITTNPSTYGFSATTGQCVSGSETYDNGEYYTQWTVGACPTAAR